MKIMPSKKKYSRYVNLLSHKNIPFLSKKNSKTITSVKVKIQNRKEIWAVGHQLLGVQEKLHVEPH